MSHLPADCARDEIIENYQFLHDVFIAIIILPFSKIRKSKIGNMCYSSSDVESMLTLGYGKKTDGSYKPHRGGDEVG